jgi:tellurite resistance protein
LAYITKTDEDVINEERQQAVMELWHAGVLKKFDEERLLIMAESARL